MSTNDEFLKSALSAGLIGRVLGAAAGRGVSAPRIQQLVGKTQNWMHGQLGHARAAARPGQPRPQWLADSLRRFRNPGGRRGALDRAFAADDSLGSYTALSRLESRLAASPAVPALPLAPAPAPPPARVRPQLAGGVLGVLGGGLAATAVPHQKAAASWWQETRQRYGRRAG